MRIRILTLSSMVLAIAFASPAAAQTGPLPLPAPPAVSQSEPGHGPLQEHYNQLVQRQRAFNQARDEHNSHCMGIPRNEEARIAACQASKQRLDRERAAYGTALQEYDAKQAFYQGRTLYLRKDYDGAIAKYETAQRLLPPSSRFEGDVNDELDLARSRKELSAGRGVSANGYLLNIEKRANRCPDWLRVEIESMLVDFRRWVQRQRKKVEVRTPAAVCGVRG